MKNYEEIKNYKIKLSKYIIYIYLDNKYFQSRIMKLSLLSSLSFVYLISSSLRLSIFSLNKFPSILF